MLHPFFQLMQRGIQQVPSGHRLLVQNHRAHPLCQGPTLTALHALLLATSPWAQASPLAMEQHLTAPLWTYAIAYTSSQSLCELETPRSCYKGAVRSLPTTLERDSNKPDDNAAPEFSLSTLGRTSRWQRNCLPHHRCRCRERFFPCFSPVLIFQEDEIVFVFFFLNWIVMGFEVPLTLWVLANSDENGWWISDIFVLLFLCLMFRLWNLKMLRMWLLFLHDKGCFYHSPVILQGLHMHSSITLLYQAYQVVTCRKSIPTW